MKVAVLCEFSGTVRDAFIRAGHDAISFDLLETESPGPHVTGDITKLNIDWSVFDLAIAHPPCTYLAVSGLHWNTRVPGRSEKTAEALDFVRWIMALPIKRIAVENPISCISSQIRKPEQIVQPYFFGHPESKQTCLWLKNLPKLNPTNMLEKPASGRWDNQTPSGQNKLGPSPDRWKKRSLTYPGLAEAMALQWGNL